MSHFRLPEPDKKGDDPSQKPSGTDAGERTWVINRKSPSLEGASEVAHSQLLWREPASRSLWLNVILSLSIAFAENSWPRGASPKRRASAC